MKGIIAKVMENYRLKSAYDFSSVQCDFPSEVSQEICDWGLKNIPNEMLNPNETKARQALDDIHVTVKYGLHLIDPTVIRTHFYDQKPIEVTLKDITIFDGEDGDVLKIDVESNDLLKLNEMIEKNFEHTDTFPNYHPHVTIAYLKKGCGAQFVGCGAFKGKKIKLDSVMFSGKDNRKTTIPLPKS